MKTQITNLLMLATAFLATEIVRAQNLTDNLKKGELLYQNSLTSKTDITDWTMEGPGVIEFKEGWMEMYSPDEKFHHVFWCPKL